jgi:4-amino-4-deoxy-L-arabinose transferase-like glycosyltransferase
MGKKFWYYIFLAAVYISLFIVPVVNIPISDDHLYFESVRNLAEENEINIPKDAAPSFIAQLFYSTAFVKLFGLSHISLTVLTIILSGATVLAAFIFLKKFVSEDVAFLGSLILLFTPTFFNLSHTFMTDIHAFFFALLSLVAVYKGFEKNEYKYVLVGSLLLIVSFLIRQWYVTFILGFSLFYFINKRKIFLQKKYIATLLIIPLIVFGIWFYWNTYLNSVSTFNKFFLPVQFDLPIMANNFMKILFFSGIFLFPLGIILLLNPRKLFDEIKRTKKLFLIISILILVITSAWFVFRYTSDLGIIFPGNHIVFMYASETPGIPGSGRPLILIPMFALGMLVVFYFFIKIFQENFRKNFLLYILVIFILPIIPTIGVKDRYFLLLIPLLLAFLLPKIREMKFFREILVISVILFAVWSWYGTSNYLNWNLADVEANNFLKEIDGVKSVDGDQYEAIEPYKISPNVETGYETLREFPVSDIFGNHLSNVYVLKRYA